MPTSRSRRAVKSCIVPAPAILGCLALALWSQAALAQSDAPPVAKTTSYLPSISDFMIATIQPPACQAMGRGTQQGLALRCLRTRKSKRRLWSPRPGLSHGARDSAARHDLVGHRTTLRGPAQGDPGERRHAFDKAYGDLTSACNACHQGTNHGVVVIRAPADTSLSDQDFESVAP
jgi:hypothetical protein